VGRKWARDLMDDGVHGLIVDYNDVVGLRQAIRWVLDDPDKARAMADRGQDHARSFSTRRCMETLYQLAVTEPGREDREAASWQHRRPAMI